MIESRQPELFHDGAGLGIEMLWSMEPRAFARLQDRLAKGPAAFERRSETNGAAGADLPYTRKGTVAIIPFGGTVTKGAPPWWYGQAVSTVETRAALDAALADPLVKSILLLVDSPGGTVAGVADLADAIFAARDQKPICAYAEDLMASAAYWVGSQASRIVGNSTAMVGSIGVFTVLPDFSRLVKNLGVDVHVVRSAPGKGAGTLGTTVTEPQLADVQAMIDSTHDLFVSAVARGRGMPIDKAGDLADGRIQIGQAAVDSGLMDSVASLDSVIAEMQAADMPKEPPKKMNPMPGMKPESNQRTEVIAHPSAQKEAPVSEPTLPDSVKVYVDASVQEAVGDLKARIADQDLEIAALKASKEIEGVIAQATADRKITPALLPVARTIAQHGGLNGLKAYVASLQPTAPGGGTEFVRTAGDAELAGDDTIPAVQRAPHDHVSGAAKVLNFAPDRMQLHRRALAFQAAAKAAGEPITYQQAVIAVTRKSAAAQGA